MVGRLASHHHPNGHFGAIDGSVRLARAHFNSFARSNHEVMVLDFQRQPTFEDEEELPRFLCA